MDSGVLSNDVHGHGDNNNVSNDVQDVSNDHQDVRNDVQESESNDGHETMICEPEISSMNAGNRFWTPNRLREMEGDSRFKLCAWVRGFRGPGHHHKVYRRVYVDDLYTSWVKCLICNDYVKYDMRTGTSYLLRHLQKIHPNIDLDSLPEPDPNLYEAAPPVYVKEKKDQKRKSSGRPRGRPRKERKDKGYSYMDEIRWEEEEGGECVSDEADLGEEDHDRAIKLLTGLLVKQDANIAPERGKKRLEEFTDADFDREMKELSVKKARAELREVEIRIKEREERINLYKVVETQLNVLVDAAKVLVLPMSLSSGNRNNYGAHVPHAFTGGVTDSTITGN